MIKSIYSVAVMVKNGKSAAKWYIDEGWGRYAIFKDLDNNEFTLYE